MQLSSFCAFSQDTAVTRTIDIATQLFKKLPSEKLYLSFDKPYYIAGDTICGRKKAI
jgi:hypothetical protein